MLLIYFYVSDLLLYFFDIDYMMLSYDVLLVNIVVICSDMSKYVYLGSLLSKNSLVDPKNNHHSKYCVFSEIFHSHQIFFHKNNYTPLPKKQCAHLPRGQYF